MEGVRLSRVEVGDGRTAHIPVGVPVAVPGAQVPLLEIVAGCSIYPLKYR